MNYDLNDNERKLDINVARIYIQFDPRAQNIRNKINMKRIIDNL